MPGGSIEPGENPKRAAEREVCEESGVTGQIVRSLGQVVVRDILYYCSGHVIYVAPAVLQTRNANYYKMLYSV